MMATPKKDTSILSILTTIVLFIGILYIACCGDRGGMIVESSVISASSARGGKSQKIMLTSGTKMDDVLNFQIYAPYDRTALSDGARSAYGHLGKEGTTEEGEYLIFYLDLQGDYGRVSANDMGARDTNSTAPSYMQTLEFHPSAEYYIEEMIHGEYLEGMIPTAGRWELSLYPEDDAWHLSLTMDSGFVKCIVDTTTTVERRE